MPTLTPATTIDHPTAERLRSVLGEIQRSVIEDNATPWDERVRLVTKISEVGFRLADELEGVIR